jgi:hypothetical protein
MRELQGGLTMKNSKLNRDWHKGNRMPVKASLEQRLKWHMEHSKNCKCRPMPDKIIEELKKRNMELPRPGD